MVIDMTRLSWNDINQLSAKIHNETKHLDANKSVAIIGISRGGLIPAVLLSHLKADSLFFSVGVKSYSKQTRTKDHIYQLPDLSEINKLDTIYLVDDICDTGLTFKNLIKTVFNEKKIYTIAFTCREKCLYKPDFVGKMIYTDDWLVFPWEKE